MQLENLKETESEEYRTGIGNVSRFPFPNFLVSEGTDKTSIEVPDLTHPTNVELFRRWDQTSIEFIDLLRFIRINSVNHTTVIVSRPGKHESLKIAEANEMKIDT